MPILTGLEKIFIKDFDAWNELAKRLEEKEPVFCHAREIWWASVGINNGTEVCGKNELFERPVLVVHVYNHETVLILPVTARASSNTFFRRIEISGKPSYVMLSQFRTISTRRLSKKQGWIPKSEFDSILQAAIDLIMQNSA